jgi:hypothetical protein
VNSCLAFLKPDGRRSLAIAVFALALLWPASPAFAEAPAADAKRFLFIIDMSATMKPMEDAVSETLFDLVYSGVRGHMTNGDTYGIWLVNELQNDTSFKMEVWKHKYAVEAAARAVKHVKERGFKGKARLSQAMADAAVVIKNVEDLKVILISNGETPITGTPFNDIINLRFREMAPHMKRAKATLNTALVAQEGRIVAWAANSPEFLIEIPYVAPRPPKPKLAASRTNSETAATVNTAAAASNEPPKLRVASNPIIITRETVAEEKRTWRNLTTTAGNESTGSTNTTIGATTSTLSSATNTFAITNTPATPASNEATAANVVTQGLALGGTPAAKPATVASAEPASRASLETVPSIPVAPATPSEPSSSTSRSPIFWAGIGAAAAFVFVLGGFIMARSKREHPSLISQSIAHERAT